MGDKMGKMMVRSGLASTVAYVALSATSTIAQSTTPVVDGSSPVALQKVSQAPTSVPETQESAGVPDIVVTAQRREERLQRVPLSITAITGKELRNADIRDITRLEQAVPGLRIGRSGAAARPALRGVYTEAVQANADPRIGFYIDEIYQSRSAQTSGAFVDLERVEVQKGPQGTLFGRNSLGGNIALSSAKPTDKYDMGIAMIYGNYNRLKVEGFLNVPLAEGLAFRLAGAIDRHDPYLKSTVSRAADIGDLDYHFFRGTLRYAPPSMDNRLEVVLRGSYFNENDRGLGSFNAKNIGAIVDGSLIRAPGGSVTYNGVTYPFPNGYNGGNYATGVLVPFSPVFRDGIADINGADIGIPVGGKYEVPFDFTSPTNKIKAKNASAIINFGLTDNIRLRSLTGFSDFSYVNRADGDGGPIPFREFYFITTAKTLTQELQLQSSNASSPLQYTLGGFYMDDKVGEGSASVFSQQNYRTVDAPANGYPVLYRDGGFCGYTLVPRVPNCNSDNTTAADGIGPVKAHTKSWAGYGQASYTIARKLTLTAGARYTVDDKDYRQGAQPGGTFSTFVGGSTGYVFLQNQAFLNANPGATQAQLPFPGDARAATLIRLGGANAGFTNGVGYRAILPFNSDRADANLTCGGATPGTFGLNGTSTVVGTIPNYLYTRCGQRKFKYWTYRVAADYKFTPDNMVYASFSTGVHSGGFGASFAPTTIPQGTFASYDAERVRAFELGTKNSFFDNRLQLNAALFYAKYTDNQVQGTQFIGLTGTTIGTIANVGNTTAPGAEVSFIAKPTRQLTLRGAVNYLHARNSVAPLGIFASGLCTISTGVGSPCATPGTFNGLPVSGSLLNGAGLGSGFFPNPRTNPELFTPVFNAAGAITGFNSLFFGTKTRVQNTPDWSANFGAGYEIPLGRGSTLTPEADVLFSGNYLLSASAPNFLQKAYAKVDARITFRSENGLSVQAFVQNLTNKATLGRITTGTLSAQGTYSDPRTYGVRVGYRF